MGDVFKEQLVKRQGTVKDTAIKVCLFIIVGLIGFMALLQLGSLGVLITFALVFGARFLISYLNVEYEYVFTNGELDIDIIYDQARRKRLFSVHLKSVEIMAHIDDKNHEHTFNSAQAILDYSSGTSGPNTYAFIAVHQGKKTKIIIEPNDKMLKAFSSTLTRRNLHLRAGVNLV
ncbi:MAG: DUF6106 family protein [Defluviitaleaceae bacterium]|nr:DUF6106 family protein [Defluviitaleaceae bacterium]MCL2262006.1 DUF6106 family protein [Defluviitaleaceae bacterium]